MSKKYTKPQKLKSNNIKNNTSLKKSTYKTASKNTEKFQPLRGII